MGAGAEALPAGGVSAPAALPHTSRWGGKCRQAHVTTQVIRQRSFVMAATPVAQVGAEQRAQHRDQPVAGDQFFQDKIRPQSGRCGFQTGHMSYRSMMTGPLVKWM